jgi:hypothetical protein
MVTEMLVTLPATFVPTRESLRALACYVVSPARKARTAHIGLRPATGGFATPPFDDGSRLVVRGQDLAWDPGASITLSTLRAAAAFVDVELSPDPGVGHDLPPFRPDADLDVDASASAALGSWYRFGEQVIEALASRSSAGQVSEAQIWPEHFDLAVTVEAGDSDSVNVGFSPGDSFSDDPYVYVGPHDIAGLSGPYWNAPFGAFLAYSGLAQTNDPVQVALDFVVEGLDLASAPA